ncbi:hypothetical protein [Marinimicrobium alkaliphilum]|uniref:hypothetical protein n=1 Tax=Marinimicrobium alkaliphilum TaxID=2202654 RepID=UPI0013008F96|nr:hypothetical protein [Marinimicrobium alkaliphilum]
MKITIVLLIFLSCVANASTPIEFHAHEMSMSGVLPQPYGTLEFTIRLNEETDDVEEFVIFRGAERIHVPDGIISQLTDIELGTLQVSHEMHRGDDPFESLFGDDGDWLHFTFEHGPRHRAEAVRDEVPVFQWGRDRITVTIIKGKDVTVTREPLVDSYEGWRERTW